MASLVIVTGYTSINAVVKAELFPAHIRALGVALPFALANAIFGGTAEYVALWLKASATSAGSTSTSRPRGDVADCLRPHARDQDDEPDRGRLAAELQPASERLSSSIEARFQGSTAGTDVDPSGLR